MTIQVQIEIWNDFVLEAAIVGRQSWRDIVQASNQKAINERFTREGLTKLKSRIGQHDPGDWSERCTTFPRKYVFSRH